MKTQIAVRALRRPNFHKKTVGIIGGKGLMGRFLRLVFKRAGFNVLVSDISTGISNVELAKKSDVILFSVPIHKTQKIIRGVVPYTRPDQLLLDCTSIKTMPVREMNRSAAEVIGLHPMFRPGPTGLRNQTVVMCLGRAKKSTEKFVKNIFVRGGAKIVKMTPMEHDRLMSIIQVLLHFHTIVLGHAMRRLGVPIKKTLKVASPIYRLEMNIIGRIFSQDPMLYGSIEMLNPKTKKVIFTLLSETAKLAKIVLKKDLEQFSKIFNRTSKFLGSYKKKAMKEINLLLGTKN